MIELQQAQDATDDFRFRLAMRSSGVGMAIVDTAGCWVEVNPALERMLGYSAAEMTGRPSRAFTHPDDSGMSDDRLAELVEGSRPMLDMHKRYLCKDGSVVWAHVNVAAMRGADDRARYLIAQIRDITAQHDAEQALRELNDTLEQRVGERTAELLAINRQQELFAYGVSHDLRAPLRAIDSFASLLASHAGDALDDTSRDYVARIRAASRRMAELVDALLDLSRANRAEMKHEPVDLSLLAEWVYAELADAEPGRSATITVQPGLACMGDERQLKLLLRQVMHNAWRFSREAGQVVIEVGGRVVDGRLLLSVRDHGMGFDMRYVGKLFEPFQRLHGPEQGTGNGIGLAIAQRVADRHGARLWAESEPGQGSTFHLELTAAPARPPCTDAA